MKKVFIDCGTHLFQGFCLFVEKYNIDETWMCYSFEANPLTFEMSKDNYNTLTRSWGLNIKHYNKAVYNKSTKIKVNCSLDSLGYVSQASNILKSPPCYDNIWKNSFEYKDGEVNVETINFSKFLKDNVSIDDFVVVKMDIEGAEFVVIDSLIESGSYKLIDKFYCEFHERFFDNEKEYQSKKIKFKEFFAKINTPIEEWI